MSITKEEKMFYCRKPNGVLTTLRTSCARANSRINKMCGGWKYFLADCPKGNMLCSSMSGAFLPAITVCGQRLF